MKQNKLTFDEGTHQYFWDGRGVPGVTTVLSSVGIKRGEFWKPIGFNDQFISDDIASNFGSAFHKIAGIIRMGQVPSFPAEMAPWVEQFHRFHRENLLVPISDDEGNLLIEYPMYHEVLGYAGTPDEVSMYVEGPLLPKYLWGSIIVPDWKTSTSEQKHYRLQAAAYAELVKKVFGIRKTIVPAIIRFTEDGYFPDVRINRPEDFIGFNSCLNIFKMAA